MEAVESARDQSLSLLWSLAQRPSFQVLVVDWS